MYGSYEGQDVCVGVRSYTTGSGKNRQTHYFTFIDIVFDVPLKRGLAVRPAGGVSRFFGSLFGQRDIQIGDAQFDKDFRIDGVDPQQVSQLLLFGKMRAMLPRTYPNKFVPSLSDDRTRLEASGIVVDASVLAPQLSSAVALHRELVASWSRLPLSLEQRAIEAGWQHVASTRRLTLDLPNMIMHGAIDDVAVRLEVVLSKDNFVTLVAAGFNPPLAVGLAMSRHGALSSVSKFFGAQDLEVGDADFDKRYIIKGKDHTRVKQIFASEARGGLHHLDEISEELAVDDNRILITLPGAVGEHTEIEALVETISKTANAMVKFRRPVSAGPFR